MSSRWLYKAWYSKKLIVVQVLLTKQELLQVEFWK